MTRKVEKLADSTTSNGNEGERKIKNAVMVDVDFEMERSV